jgi:hypothetical protein
MQFNSEANSNDLYTDFRELCGISSSDTTTFTTTQFARKANFGQERGTTLVLKADGRWQHDDTSNTSTELLDVTTNLASGTGKYATSVTWLKIARVRIKDAQGNWKTLTRKDRRDISDDQLVASGTPDTYDITGNWIYIRPIPNYASTAGLEVQFQRGPSYFVPGDTTKTPGFASPFHRLCSLYPALEYCEDQQMDWRVQSIRGKIADTEAELIAFYSERNDEKLTLTTPREDYGEDYGG